MLQSSLDSIGRRSRFVRTRIGKRIVMGERDIEILRCLHRYRYLRQSHLLALFRPQSEKRFIERLGDLFHETGLIDRPESAVSRFEERASPMLYAISIAGVAFLETGGRLPDRAVSFSLKSSHAANPQFGHMLLIVDALVKVELTIRDTPDQRFVPLDEILRKAPEATRRQRNPLCAPVTLPPTRAFPTARKEKETFLIPDALYGIEYLIDGEKRYRFFALECDRTTPSWRSGTDASSIAKKRAAYDAFIRSRGPRRHWGIPNLSVSFVSGTRDG